MSPIHTIPLSCPDRQRELPLARCRLCGGELYRQEYVYWLEGGWVCPDCLLSYARRYFAPHLRPLEEVNCP